MNSIDPRTVVQLTGIMGALMSLVLFFMRRNFPLSIKGLSEWAASPFILFVSAVLGSLRGSVHEFVSIAIPNVLLFVGVYAAYQGSQRFFGVATAIRRWIAVLALITLVTLWFTLVDPSYRARLMLLSLPLGLVFALHAHLVFRQATRSFSSWLALVVLLCAVAIQILRFVSIWANPHVTSVFDPDSSQALFLAAYTFVILLFSISVVLMATDRLRAEFEHLAAHDSLTDAYTRRHMNEACEQELERCRRNGQVMSLLMMDLDNFKAINDTYGHQTGDRMLIEFAVKIKALLRRQDQLGRFGGEEFVLLLPETPLEVALVVAERIRAMTDQSETKPHCTVSIGVTTNRHDNDTLDTLLSRADAAMYRAKDKGRNRIETA
jgi:diguanylate cyclase (GGDEF)-like protein